MNDEQQEQPAEVEETPTETTEETVEETPEPAQPADGGTLDGGTQPEEAPQVTEATEQQTETNETD